MTKPFEKGHPKYGGRVKGARNKLSADFLSALAEDFAKHGAKAIRVTRVENPAAYAKIIASVLPKEFEINDNRLKDIPDEQLDAFIEFAQQHLAGRTRSLEGREDETAH
jgi:hypothetical protein